MSAEPLFTLDALDYRAGGRALLMGIAFTLGAGPPTVILGPNGAGKSLLLRLCHGLLAPAAGGITWADNTARARQAMVFQRPVMLRRSVLGNLRFAVARAGVPRSCRAARAAEALDRAGLADQARQPARALSGGEQQRLALARAWATGPRVLFMDEPTASLDPAATRRVEAMTTAIAAEGTKVVLTTHDLGQARRLAGEVLFLHRGRLLEHAPAERFFDAPASAEAHAFLAGELLW